MGILQSQNELAELTSDEKIKFEDPRSVKQMLIDNGEWTEEDEIMEDSTDLEEKLEDIEELSDYQQYQDSEINSLI